MVPIFQIRKLRFREVSQFVQVAQPQVEELGLEARLVWWPGFNHYTSSQHILITFQIRPGGRQV